MKTHPPATISHSDALDTTTYGYERGCTRVPLVGGPQFREMAVGCGADKSEGSRFAFQDERTSARPIGEPCRLPKSRFFQPHPCDLPLSRAQLTGQLLKDQMGPVHYSARRA